MSESILQRHHVRRAGLFAAAIVVAVVFFALGALARLLLGPVSLGPLSGGLSDAISTAVPGFVVRYDDAALQWSRDEGRINLVILGARVFDRNQHIIAQAPKAEVDLAAAPILAGKIVVRRIALVGVQLTLVHAMDGALRLGFGHDNKQSDVLKRLRATLASGNAGGAAASSLRSFAVRRARLAFYDERTGLFIVAPEAQLQITTEKGNLDAGVLDAAVDAEAEISGHRMHLIANLKLPRDGETVSGDVSITGLDVSAVGQNAKALAFLKPYGLKMDVTGSFVLDQGSTHVRSADFGLGGSGTVSGLGHPVRVKSLKLVGRYDGRTGRVLIDDGSLEGNEARAHLSGSGNLVFNSTGGLEKGDVDLVMDKIGVDMPGVMQKAVTLTRIALRASYTPDTGKIEIGKLLAFGGPLSATLSGEVTLSPGQTPAIAVSGHIDPLSVSDLLKYWPLQLGEGAREWTAANVSAGTVGPVVLKTNIAAGALDGPMLPEDAVNLTFPIQGATVTYVKGLTPLTQLTGTGTLTGDTFKADITSAKIGALDVSQNTVTIPNLHIPGAPGDITGHVEGAISDVLTLIDMKPLRYPTRFHIGTSSAKGQAAIDLKFHVPMIHDLDVNDVGISVKGKMTGIALAVGDHNVTGGNADLEIDNSSLHMDGNVDLAGASLNVVWDEAFKAKGPITTRVAVSGTLSDETRQALGFHSGQFLKGPVNATASLQGHRGNITQANMTMELTPATVMLDLINYRKPPGVAATVQVTARFKGGAITGEDIALSGAGLNAQGTAAFGADGTLQKLEFPVVRAGPDNNFALKMTDTPASGLKVAVSGVSMDGTGLGRIDLSNDKNGEANPGNEPFAIDVNLDRVVLRKAVTLAPFALSISGTGDKPQTLALSGTMSTTAKLSGDLVTDGKEREIRLQTNNAGLLLKGLFGFTSMRGGKLGLTAALSPAPTKTELAANKKPDFRGKLSIRNFTIINQPFLTRLFSAGSLGGLADLLGGKGIAVDKLDAPFTMHGGVLDIHDARANGPSIGITADGYLDRRNNKVALEGALAPIYGLNSMLGNIPVLGDVLVSKKGEGIIGMSYSVKGNADEPEVFVNPLSVLTPGIFRRIFEGTPKAPASVQAKEGNKSAQDAQKPPAAEPKPSEPKTDKTKPAESKPPESKSDETKPKS